MKLKTDKSRVGLRINNIRLNLSDTLEQFGKKFNADKSNILRWEQGKTLPNKQRLSIIANLGGITLNELMYGSIDEFISNNTDTLLEHVGFPFPKTFKMFDIKNGIEIYIDFEREHNNKEVTINDLDYLIKIFSLYINDIIEETIIRGIDYNIELLENNETETISLLKSSIDTLNTLNNKMCPIDISLLETDAKTFYLSFIRLLKENLLAKVNYYPIFDFLVKQLKTDYNKPLHQRLYEIIDKYISDFTQQPENTQIKNKLVDEIIETIKK